MPLRWEHLLSMLGPEMGIRLNQMGLESLEDFRYCFTSFEDIQVKFPEGHGWTDADHSELFQVWSIVRAVPDGTVTDAQVDDLSRRMRRRRPPVEDRPVPQVHVPPPLTEAKAARRVLPLDASSTGSAKVARAKSKVVPLVAAREEVIRQVHSLYLALGDRGARWIGCTSHDISFDFVARAVETFDEPTIKRHLHNLAKFRDFVHERDKSAVGGNLGYLEPGLPNVVAYLQNGDKRGNTVSRGYYYALMWWQTHLGMPFQTDHSATEVFATHRAGHVSRQAEVIAIDVVVKLLRLASGFGAAESRGAVAQIVRMTLVFLASSVRFAHFRRSTFLGADARFLHFRCAKGKRRDKGTRPGFDWSVARFLVSGVDILGGLLPLFEELGTANHGTPSCPMPDVALKKDQPLTNDATFIPSPMSFSKFTRLLQGILAMTGGKSCHPRGITTYAFRRFCITIANVCRFHPEDQTAIGNWVETISVAGGSSTRRTCFATRTHYAGAKAHAAADVRLITLLAVAEACKSLDRSTIEHAEVACVAHMINDIWISATATSASAKSWVQPLPSNELPSCIASAQKCGDAAGDDSDASEDSEVKNQEAEPLLEEPVITQDFQWFKQRSVIHVAAESESFVALCSGKTFAREPLAAGDSLESALGCPGQWCRECLRKVPLAIKEALVLTRADEGSTSE